MHYTYFQWFLVPICVSAYLVPSSGGSSRVHNLQYIQLFFTHFCEKQLDVLKIVNSRRPPWGWHKVCRNTCRNKKSLKKSVVHLLDRNKINFLRSIVTPLLGKRKKLNYYNISISGTRNLNNRQINFIFLSCLWVQGVTGISHAQNRDANDLHRKIWIRTSICIVTQVQLTYSGR
jgi:hypothetical protein